MDAYLRIYLGGSMSKIELAECQTIGLLNPCADCTMLVGQIAAPTYLRHRQRKARMMTSSNVKSIANNDKYETIKYSILMKY